MAKLKDTLALLFFRAWNGRDVRQHVQLGQGLKIHLYVTRTAEIHLLLGRMNTYPSDQEWVTVLDHWPRALPTPRPVPEKVEVKFQGERTTYGLKAVWTTPPVPSWIRDLPAREEATK